MNRSGTVILALALFATLLGSVGTASASTTGFAVYSVQVSSAGYSQSLTVNESVSATSNVHYDKLILGIVSGTTELNYTRSINSSLDVTPFLPSISNQTFSYSSASESASVAVAQNGTIPIKFNGANYKLTSYSLKATVTANGTTTTDKGALETFPSGLVYSVRVSAQVPDMQALQNFSLTLPATAQLPTSGTVTLMITLLSTSMPLSAPAPSSVEQVASIGVGAGAAVSVLALGLGVRRHNRHSEPKTNPEYAVD